MLTRRRNCPTNQACRVLQTSHSPQRMKMSKHAVRSGSSRGIELRGSASSVAAAAVWHYHWSSSGGYFSVMSSTSSMDRSSYSNEVFLKRAHENVGSGHDLPLSVSQGLLKQTREQREKSSIEISKFESSQIKDRFFSLWPIAF